MVSKKYDSERAMDYHYCWRDMQKTLREFRVDLRNHPWINEESKNYVLDLLESHFRGKE